MPTVSYNAAAFDDEQPPPNPAAHSGPPTSAPTTPYSGTDAQAVSPPQPEVPQHPVSGPEPTPDHPTTPPQPPSGSFGVPRPQTGSFGAPAVGAFSQQQVVPGDYGHSSGGPTTAITPPGFTGVHPTATTGAYAPPSAASSPRSRKKPLLIGLGALVLVGALVAGYFVFFTFGGIQNSRGDIKNAKGFADSASITWQASLPDDGITVAKDAGCFYILNDGAEITNQLACGPALRAGAQKGHVWDIYHFDVSGSGDNQRATALSETPKLGQPAPEKGSIVDVSGDEAADGADLESPPMPKADENGVWTDEEFVVDEDSKGNEIELADAPTLVAPGASVTINAIVEYGVADIDGQPRQAADDQEFYLITMTGDGGPIDGSLSSTIDFDLAGAPVSGSIDPASMGEVQMLVSVPTSGDSYLVLTCEDHTQSLSLADGTRVADPTTDLYYSGDPEPTTDLSGTVEFPEKAITKDEDVSLTVSLLKARLKPYSETHGWAPDGKVWLIVTMGTKGQTIETDTKFDYYSIDCSSSALDGGETQSCESDADVSQQAVWIVAVAPDTTAFKGSFAATMTAWGEDQDDESVDFGAKPVEFAF